MWMKPAFNSKSYNAISGSLNYQKEEVSLASYPHMADTLQGKAKLSTLILHVCNRGQGCLFIQALKANF